MSEPENNGGNNGPEKVEQPHGGALNSGGTPGNKGGGRPPQEFRERMRQLISRDDVEAYFEECLTGKHGPKIHVAALAYASDRGYGKAAQPIVGEDGGPVRTTVTLRMVKAKTDDDDSG